GGEEDDEERGHRGTGSEGGEAPAARAKAGQRAIQRSAGDGAGRAALVEDDDRARPRPPDDPPGHRLRRRRSYEVARHEVPEDDPPAGRPAPAGEGGGEVPVRRPDVAHRRPRQVLQRRRGPYEPIEQRLARSPPGIVVGPAVDAHAVPGPGGGADERRMPRCPLAEEEER